MKPATLKTIRTRRGWRLVQHGTVLSEVLAEPGPTHSVFDVIAAACRLHPAPHDIALLGFGGGGVVAAMRALGIGSRVHGVDLDPTGAALITGHGSSWREPLHFDAADAVTWLRGQPRRFDVIVDDLSIPVAGDVVKPPATWSELPGLMASRLRPGGLAIFNLLQPASESWAAGIARVLRPLGHGVVIGLEEFENRIVLGGTAARRAPRDAGRMIRSGLRVIQSRQAEKLCIRSWKP